ncbi:MAG: tRNA (adenosine(37)-N6)-threonylcarbamoyltransferase complex dimerization subunit type 1 TsaB [Deltaproteobacteria bacterium]|nr:tRNA (adenosine(37)-N6)-threonylcarbamoyltransferase complex dimerization subunit type 1 TsaB [Deltaproteobacteria bacterium]
MKLLALDTSTFTASVAVLSDGTILEERDAKVRPPSESLLVLVRDALSSSGVTLRDLDAIACGVGPGSFTGLRIGLATAKGLCFAAQKPLVSVSSLAALALEAAKEARAGKLVLAILDAKRRELYAGLFRMDPNGSAPVPVTSEVVLGPDELGAFVRAHAGSTYVVVVGDGIDVYPEAAAQAGRVLSSRRTPSAAAVGTIATARLAGGVPDEIATATPAYLRPTEAELKFPEVKGGDPHVA